MERKEVELCAFEVTDRMKPEDFGLSLSEIDSKLFNTWKMMMYRCYGGPESHKAKYYQNKNIFVNKDWHEPETFIRDVKEIPHWWYKENNWDDFSLDKDYYGANFYSKESCVWIHQKENTIYATAEPLIAEDNNGGYRVFLSVHHAASVLGGNAKAIRRLAKGQFQLNRFGKPILKSNNKHLGQYSFSILDKQKMYRLEIIEDGEMGPVYGKQWRDFDGVDQIANVIEQIKTNPDSRRMIVSAWNVAEIEGMALPPCHTMFQFYVHDGKLSCQLYQRSGDVFLGIPFNIASYALLTHLIANETGLEVGEFIHTIGDAHLYTNHMEQINLQLSRETYDLPKLVLLHPEKSIFDMNSEDIIVEDYRCHKTIKAPIAV